MSYERDRDRVTRGVGAIAALDHVMPERQRRRVEVGRRLRRRDRAMSAVSRGALGLVIAEDQAGGGTNTYATKVRIPVLPIRVSATLKPVAQPPAPTVSPVPLPPPPPPPLPPALRIPVPLTPVAVLPPALVPAPIPIPVSTPVPVAPVPPAPGPYVTQPIPVVSLVPPPAPASSTPPATATVPLPLPPKIVTVSGGGGMVPAKSNSPPIIGTMTPGAALPEIPEATSDTSVRNAVLLAAGAGALVYYLFFRGNR